ncbi:hypothetical protein ABM428_17050 (plasmid) [Sulfitobacter sp. TCYB15]|uniref:Uncharacterized protein n=1 Tax=Sulfitobacter sp. TCYB15 TaxID=3229275 RepID=A0AAU8C8T8_9RHOB|nr:hypothetical protein [uncultured Sulfitobacter sp.]
MNVETVDTSTSAKRVLLIYENFSIACCMLFKTRLFLVALLVGAVLAQTTFASISSVDPAPEMAMQSDCCPSDCPDMPECDAACISTTQCRVVPIVAGLERVILANLPRSGRAGFLRTEATAILQHADGGLQRPPKA